MNAALRIAGPRALLGAIAMTAQFNSETRGRRAATKPTTAAVFQNVFCSSCGHGFGPGLEGFSHCADHAHLRAAS